MRKYINKSVEILGSITDEELKSWNDNGYRLISMVTPSAFQVSTEEFKKLLPSHEIKSKDNNLLLYNVLYIFEKEI